MIDVFTKAVSRCVPFILIIVAVLIVLNAVFEGISFMHEAFYASLLLALAGVMVRYDLRLEASK